MEHTGTRIRIRRTELGISAADLASRIALSRATVHRYESGDIWSIKMPVLSAIARELDVSVAWLLGKSEVMGNAAAGVGFDTIEGVFDAVIGHLQTSNIKCCCKSMDKADRDFVSDVLVATLQLITARYR